MKVLLFTTVSEKMALYLSLSEKIFRMYFTNECLFSSDTHKGGSVNFLENEKCLQHTL